MSDCVHGDPAFTVAACRPRSWHAIIERSAASVGTWRGRSAQRRQLLDYMASDHRAAADIGIAGYEARNWALRPFWRA
jgi:uncharacterized protein YjiS (DUF1127 family)